jgi:hypothetical protein
VLAEALYKIRKPGERLPQVFLHQSSYGYSSCLFNFYLRQIEGLHDLKEAKSLEIGSMVHELWLRHHVRAILEPLGAGLDFDDLNLARQQYEAFLTTRIQNEDDRAEIVATAVRMVEALRTCQFVDPIAVEASFGEYRKGEKAVPVINLVTGEVAEGVFVSGRVDLVERVHDHPRLPAGTVSITDLKTCAQVPKDPDDPSYVLNSLQLLLYSYASLVLSSDGKHNAKGTQVGSIIHVGKTKTETRIARSIGKFGEADYVRLYLSLSERGQRLQLARLMWERSGREPKRAVEFFTQNLSKCRGFIDECPFMRTVCFTDSYPNGRELFKDTIRRRKSFATGTPLHLITGVPEISDELIVEFEEEE